MANLSRSYYPGDGTTTDFPVDFPYIDRSHIQVYVNGVLETGWTWIDTANIRFTAAPGAGTVILIKRTTSPNARLVDYVSPSSLNEEDLDTDSLQAFYLAQEATDTANAGVADDPSTGQFTAAGKRITNVQDPIDDQDAATKIWVETAFTSPLAQATSAASTATAAATTATTKAAEADADRVTVAADKAVVAADKATVNTDKGIVAADKATVAADKAIVAGYKSDVAADKATVAADRSTVATDKGIVAADKATVAADKGITLGYKNDAAASAAEAAGYAGSMTPVQDQINAATDAAFTDDDMLVARDGTTGGLLKRSWANIKTALNSLYGRLTSANTWTGANIFENFSIIAPAAVSVTIKGAGSATGLEIGRTDNVATSSHIDFHSGATSTDFDARIMATGGSGAGGGGNINFEWAQTLGSAIASAANYLANAAGKLLTTTGVWASAVPVDLGSAMGGNVAMNFANGIHWFGTLAANITFNTQTNGKYGQSGVITLTNPGGAYTVSVNTATYKTPGGSGISIGAGENKLGYYVDRDGKVFLYVAGKAVA